MIADPHMQKSNESLTLGKNCLVDLIESDGWKASEVLNLFTNHHYIVITPKVKCLCRAVRVVDGQVDDRILADHRFWLPEHVANAVYLAYVVGDIMELGYMTGVMGFQFDYVVWKNTKTNKKHIIESEKLIRKLKPWQ